MGNEVSDSVFYIKQNPRHTQNKSVGFGNMFHGVKKFQVVVRLSGSKCTVWGKSCKNIVGGLQFFRVSTKSVCVPGNSCYRIETIKMVI